MEIQEMRATFGKLQDQTLSLKPGLNCIYAPNESGKSTWSHFLRIMLYGLSTRERGDLADKNRFAPWSGAAMRGQLQVADGNGTSLTLSRDTRRLYLHRHRHRRAGHRRPERRRDAAGRTPRGV